MPGARRMSAGCATPGGMPSLRALCLSAVLLGACEGSKDADEHTDSPVDSAAADSDAADTALDSADGSDSDTDSAGDTDDTDDTGDTGEVSWPAEGEVWDNAVLVDAGGRREGALVIAGGEIAAELPAGSDWPDHLSVRDLKGAVVIPGLIDSHTHLYLSGATWWVGDTVADNLRATLYWGVLGVMDVGAPEVLFDLRDRIDRGELLGPRIAATGPFLTAEGSHPCETVNDRDLCVFVEGDGAARAGAIAGAGADWLKVALVDNDFSDWPTPRLDLGDLADIVDGGTPVVAHIAQGDDAADALAAGVTALAHPVFAEPVTPAIAALPFLSIHSTLGAANGVVALMDADLDGPDYAALAPVTRLAWRYIQTYPEVLAEGWVEDNAGWAAQLLENLAVYRAEDAPVVAGSDAGYWFVPHGRALHDELSAMVDAGWTEQEALAAATSAPAAALGWDDMGWIGAGYRADLVVLEGDPLEDITNTRRIRAVVAGGEWRTPADVLSAELLAAASPDGFCLDDRDCDGACDLVDHVCVDACVAPYDTDSGCGAERWCMPADGLAGTADGVCHEETTCDWRAQDCGPVSYAETCAPLDLDTSACVPSGEQAIFETCSWTDPAQACAQGLFCSWVDYRCYELCEPDGPDTCTLGRCNQEYASPGNPWFGLCY